MRICYIARPLNGNAENNEIADEDEIYEKILKI